MVKSKIMEQDDSSQFCFKCDKEIKQGISYLCVSLTTESETNRVIEVTHADALIIRCKECGIEDILNALKAFMIPEERLGFNLN